MAAGLCIFQKTRERDTHARRRRRFPLTGIVLLGWKHGHILVLNIYLVVKEISFYKQL